MGDSAAWVEVMAHRLEVEEAIRWCAAPTPKRLLCGGDTGDEGLEEGWEREREI